MNTANPDIEVDMPVNASYDGSLCSNSSSPKASFSDKCSTRVGLIIDEPLLEANTTPQISYTSHAVAP